MHRSTSRLRPLAAIGLVSAIALAVVLGASRLTGGASSSRSPDGPFLERHGRRLLVSGAEFRFVGLNIPQATGAPCWSQRDLEAALTSIGPGQNVIRAFVLQRTAIRDGLRDWTWVDRMLQIARAHRQRVIMVLADHWHGQPCSDVAQDRDLDWYRSGYRSDVEGTATYRQWVTEIVTRYRNDPTVAFWELVNEAQAPNRDGACFEATAGEALRQFGDDMASLVRSIDGNHLVSLGAIPGKCGTDGSDYGVANSSPSLDLCDYHDYDATVPMGRPGLQAALEVCVRLGKAFFVGEIGIGFQSVVPPTTQRRSEILDAKLGAQFAAGSTGELMWTWSQTFSDVPPRDMEIAPGDPALALLGKYRPETSR